MSRNAEPRPVDVPLGAYRLVRVLRGGPDTVEFLARLQADRSERDAFRVVVPAPRFGRSAAFLDSARRVAGSEHPLLPLVHQVGERGPLVFAITDHPRGRTLTDARPATARQVVSVGLRLARGLRAMHEREPGAGWVHGQLTPGRVRLTEHGHIVLLGMIRPALRASGVGLPGIVAEHAYLAPEQIAPGPIDQRADVWGVGVTLWGLASGSSPFRRASAVDTFRAILAGQRLPASLPVPLVQALSPCLQPAPGQRLPSLAALCAALERAAEELGGELSAAEWREWGAASSSSGAPRAWDGDATAQVVQALHELARDEGG